MGFYQLLSHYYDDIFPVGSEKLHFFQHRFQAAGVKRVLDLACGSGLLARRLARLGYEVTGVDLEEAMIDIAREKSRDEGVDATFLVGDMRRVSDFAAEASFDSVLCTGNSLAHLLRPEDVSAAIRGMAGAVRPGGLVVIQVVNFDRILAQGPTDLPDIERSDRGFAFYRRYIPRDDGLVVFASRLVTNGGATYEDEILLRPVRQQDLAAQLVAAGFSPLEFFGGFDGSPYHRAAYATIAAGSRAAGI